MYSDICIELCKMVWKPKNFADQEGFFRKQFSIFTAKISDNLFLVIDHNFRIFPIFHIFAACNVVFYSFFTRKTPISENNSFTTPFFTLFMLSHASDKHYFSKYWGDGCMGSHPHLKFWGPAPPVPPRSPPVNLSH